MSSKCIIEKYNYFADNYINISLYITNNISDYLSFFFLFQSYKCNVVKNNDKYVTLYYPNYDLTNIDVFLSQCDNKVKIYHLFDSFLYFSHILQNLQSHDLFFINVNTNNMISLKSNYHYMLTNFEYCVKKDNYNEFIEHFMKNIKSSDIISIDLHILHLFYNTNISSINISNLHIVIKIIEKNNSFLQTIFGIEGFKLLIIKYIRSHYFNKSKDLVFEYVYENIQCYPIYSLLLNYAQLFWSCVNKKHCDNIFFIKTMTFFKRNLQPDLNKRLSLENTIHFLQNHFYCAKNINAMSQFIDLMTF